MSQSLPCPYCGMIGYHMWAGAGACPGLTNPNPPIVLMGSPQSAVFTPEELDFVCCALIRYQGDLRTRTKLMERFATPEHLANHRAKIALGEQLLSDLL